MIFVILMKKINIWLQFSIEYDLYFDPCGLVKISSKYLLGQNSHISVASGDRRRRPYRSPISSDKHFMFA